MRAHPVLELLDARQASGRRDDGHRLVLAVEGGGSRATYSSGMVVAIEQLGLTECFDAVYGSSAGALAGSWLLSGQAEHCCAGWWRPGLMERVTNPRRGLRGRPVVDVDYLIRTADKLIDPPMDWTAAAASDIELHPVATDVETGGAVDLRDTIVDGPTMQRALHASACVPVLAGLPVEIDGRRYVDAAVAEPIPFRTALAQGATHVLVLRTRRADQEAIDATRLEKALVARLGASRVPGLVQVLGNRLAQRRADDDLLARASAGLAAQQEPGPSAGPGLGRGAGSGPGDDDGGPRLLEVRPPEDASTVSPLETDPDTLRRAVLVGRDALLTVLGREAAA